mmetsp:Transcript_78957/g.118702  ORF Transcript_78957/g.118702 Transcript_78957/m.118702 type:complete len:80 (+) Transcript_78957:363-602(+)
MDTGTTKNPGPGTYESTGSLSKIKYTMRPRTENSMSFTTALKNPGPGAYDNIDSINPRGNYPISKYRSSGACNINPSRS